MGKEGGLPVQGAVADSGLPLEQGSVTEGLPEGWEWTLCDGVARKQAYPWVTVWERATHSPHSRTRAASLWPGEEPRPDTHRV